jgi:hypothetical protein
MQKQVVTDSISYEEKSILRWGGAAGIIGGLVFILVPIILFGFGSQASSDPIAAVAGYPTVRTAIALGNFVNFVADVLWVPFVISLYLVLRKYSPAPAIFGSVLFILGFAVLFIETTTQIAFDPISTIFHASGTTAAEQATLALIWQATQGMFNQFDNSAVLLISAAFVVIGIAMWGASPFSGKLTGALTIALGVASAAIIAILGTTSILSAIVVLPIYIVYPIFFGWKIRKLSQVRAIY